MYFLPHVNKYAATIIQSYCSKGHVLMLDDACLAFSISNNVSIYF
jgi:hypothetical protein